MKHIIDTTVAAAIVAASALLPAAATASPPTLPRDVTQTDSRTFVATPTQCSCVTTIDGYIFSGMPYVDAATLWMNLYKTPGYVSHPPVTSISTTLEVSGTVNP